MTAFDLLEPCTHCQHSYVAHKKGARCYKPNCWCKIHVSPQWRAAPSTG